MTIFRVLAGEIHFIRVPTSHLQDPNTDEKGHGPARQNSVQTVQLSRVGVMAPLGHKILSKQTEM